MSVPNPSYINLVIYIYINIHIVHTSGYEQMCTANSPKPKVNQFKIMYDKVKQHIFALKKNDKNNDLIIKIVADKFPVVQLIN